MPVACTYLWRLVRWSTDGVALGSPYILPLTAIVFVTHLFISKDRNVVEELATCSVPIRVFTYGIFLLAVTSLVASEAIPFVYVRF